MMTRQEAETALACTAKAEVVLPDLCQRGTIYRVVGRCLCGRPHVLSHGPDLHTAWRSYVDFTLAQPCAQRYYKSSLDVWLGL